MKTFAIKTLGCKVNQYETQVMREQFLSSGLQEISSERDPTDIYVVNTCTVTQESDQKSLKYLRDAAKNLSSTVIATGCLTELDEEALRQIPNIIVVRNKDKHRISELLNLDYRKTSIIQDFAGHSRAFIKIQDGCDNICSYCKVRLARGRSKSRALKEIVEEAKGLIDRGFQEMVLTGICLGSYGKDISKELNLCSLLGEILNINGNGRFRIRLSSIEPGDITGELIDLIKTEGRLCKHLHIPFQSGDNKLLKRMNKPFTRETYINIVERIRNSISDIAITADIMVGFPGEKDENFERTLEFVKIIKPCRTHIFPFSRRKNTIAYNLDGQVEEKIIKDRIKCLAEVCNSLAKEFATKFLGKEAEVLVEKKKDKFGLFEGYSDRYLRIHIKNAENFLGKLTIVKLKETNHGFLIGSVSSKNLCL